jgi:hypothetical protein
LANERAILHRQNRQGDEYVVLLANQVVAGPFASVAEAIRAREGLRDDLP